MKHLGILLIFGGQSSEHEVSLMSAANVYQALDPDKYTVSLIKITRAGEWQFVQAINASAIGATVTIDVGNQRFVLADGTIINPDVVFPVLHGKYGEDGTIQGLLEMMDLPYVGCGVEASALCMDKVRTKRLLEQAGITITPSLHVSRHESYHKRLSLESDVAKEDFEYQVGTGPWFVKPSRAGSSVGVTKVREASRLILAVEAAFEYDDDVLIERAIAAHEVEVAVLGNNAELVVSRPGEIIPGEDFYSYDDKYAKDSKSKASFELPESIAHLGARVSELAKQSYVTLGCKGLSRVDFFVTNDGKIYVNEINTMPGFTNISMYPKLMERAGYGVSELVDKLIALALE